MTYKQKELELIIPDDSEIQATIQYPRVCRPEGVHTNNPSSSSSSGSDTYKNYRKHSYKNYQDHLGTNLDDHDDENENFASPTMALAAKTGLGSHTFDSSAARPMNSDNMGQLMQTEYKRSIYNWKLLRTRHRIVENYQNSRKEFMIKNDRIGLLRFVIDKMITK